MVILLMQNIYIFFSVFNLGWNMTWSCLRFILVQTQIFLHWPDITWWPLGQDKCQTPDSLVLVIYDTPTQLICLWHQRLDKLWLFNVWNTGTLLQILSWQNSDDNLVLKSVIMPSVHTHATFIVLFVPLSSIVPQSWERMHT